MIAIINYGAANLRSVSRAVALHTQDFVVTQDPAEVERAAAVILPGVGAAGDTVRGLERHGMVDVVKTAIADGKPYFGICMGMQVLLTESEEDGGTPCLDIYPGVVRRFPKGLTVPHMGWNQVRQVQEHPMFKGISDDAYFYFVHSYYTDPESAELVAGSTDYGVAFPSVLAHENVFATQFHPEKSAGMGLRLYGNFVQWATGEKVGMDRELGAET
jgi:glutamine amidotransferase